MNAPIEDLSPEQRAEQYDILYNERSDLSSSGLLVAQLQDPSALGLRVCIDLARDQAEAAAALGEPDLAASYAAVASSFLKALARQN